MWRFTLLLTILAMSNSHVFYRTISSLVFILWGSIITNCVDFFLLIFLALIHYFM